MAMTGPAIARSFSITAGKIWSGLSLSAVLTRAVRGRAAKTGKPAYRLLSLCVMVCSLVLCQAQTVTLAWDAVAEATGYKLYQSLAGGPWNIAITATTTSAAVPVLTNSTRYYVISWNSAGESAPSNLVTNTLSLPPPTNPPPAALPATPIDLHANLVQGHRLDVSWSSDPAASTEVWRAMEGSSYRLMATVPPGTMHYSDTSFQKRKAYIYYVRSCNAAGCSPASNTLVYSNQ